MFSVCFVASHPNPADHFSEFVQVCEQRNIPCKVIVDKSRKESFASAKKAEIVAFDMTHMGEKELIDCVKREVAFQSLVITDIASKHWILLHQQLKQQFPGIQRAVYYDNPQSYVSEEYNQLAQELIEQVSIVFFANVHHADTGIFGPTKNVSIDISGKTRIGIGFYSKKDAEAIVDIKKNQKRREKIRRDFFHRHHIEDKNQSVYVYVGGANSIYYREAFPFFIKMLEDLALQSNSVLENKVIVLQQHPRAIQEGNQDGRILKTFRETHQLPKNFYIVVSDLRTPEALSLADGVFYYQTSMAAQFVFANIPCIAQMSHDLYEDAVTRAGAFVARSAEELRQAMTNPPQKISIERIEQSLGMSQNWQDSLVKFLQTVGT